MEAQHNTPPQPPPEVDNLGRGLFRAGQMVGLGIVILDVVVRESRDKFGVLVGLSMMSGARAIDSLASRLSRRL